MEPLTSTLEDLTLKDEMDNPFQEVKSKNKRKQKAKIVDETTVEEEKKAEKITDITEPLGLDSKNSNLNVEWKKGDVSDDACGCVIFLQLDKPLHPSHRPFTPEGKFVYIYMHQIPKGKNHAGRLDCHGCWLKNKIVNSTLFRESFLDAMIREIREEALIDFSQKDAYLRTILLKIERVQNSFWKMVAAFEAKTKDIPRVANLPRSSEVDYKFWEAQNGHQWLEISQVLSGLYVPVRSTALDSISILASKLKETKQE